ncbi:cation:proton antiporter [Halobacteriales archaeon QS_1_68_17]|nr:MAG: cation:proton antiporter [Halobacteriales archaeon QS_1_68_17]
MAPTPVEAGLLVVILGSALATAVLRDVLGSIIAFSAYSLGVAMLWVVLRAPDVGLTEAAVGAGVMTILLLLTIAKTVRPSEDRVLASFDPKTLVLVAAFVLALGATVPALPAVGSPDAPVVSSEVSQYYLDHAYKDTGVENVVTAVLAAYRGFDTLGEAVVVFTAGVAVVAVLKREVTA